ncbi:uncharacterized protein LOC105201687 isoform X2 [Solenopsis invicta]|uniref:uncharacterized protein LOC105201687 isoform X2 n=1 Tax=Solenopsis invicta TaxID=13686 RepID=UPI00193DBBDD|nr:uncharacterized protein LOC105201687 isoform X2 [Solenopsis invicta]XP_039313708.1 uncharacterized protein LOC105201687 isoform X2 [Solenopsis invicta]
MEPKGAIKKIKKFQQSWLDEVNFKGWLAPHPTENKAICYICNKTISCNKTHLMKHSQTVKHIDKVASQNKENNNNRASTHNENVKRAEIKLTAFFAEHNIAFSTADLLIPLLKDICVDSKIVQDIKLGQTKCKNILTNVIAKHETNKLVEYLKTCKFSILIDESTDISNTKIMCILVWFVSPIDKVVTTQLLDLISIDAKDGTAETIFQVFKNLLKEKEILINNVVGMASDNAAVMIGNNNSFMSRLKLEVPGLVTLNCICHSSALVSSKACEQLPQSCEHLIRSVTTYFSNSAKRCAILDEFQIFFNVERNKLVKLSNTRWLVLHKYIVRFLDNWEVFKHYFMYCIAEEKSKSAEVILEQLNNISIKAYLLVLKYSLDFFNSFNALFQSRKILIHKLFV